MKLWNPILFIKSICCFIKKKIIYMTFIPNKTAYFLPLQNLNAATWFREEAGKLQKSLHYNGKDLIFYMTILQNSLNIAESCTIMEKELQFGMSSHEQSFTEMFSIQNEARNLLLRLKTPKFIKHLCHFSQIQGKTSIFDSHSPQQCPGFVKAATQVKLLE